MSAHQEPVAIVGFACRLPGGNHSPSKLWEFLEQGKVASNQVPASRFNIKGHWDGSHKPGTMRPPGGMFLDDVDLADFDASFFEISGTEAVAMDPNQRQMLEVVYEGLENAGLPLEKLSGRPVACFVGAYSSDYGDMQNRDPEDRPANNAIGVGRAIMANRISYFLNIKGPSITIDTACSGSLVGLDLACRELQSNQVEAAIVATSNLYFNPDHVIDAGNVGQAHSPSGYCHTFDVSADGYVKAEAVSCVIVKRLADAIRDRDPIRGIIRGLASNSNGRTGGIASPSAEAQAAAIRAAYQNAGISNLNDTQYLECHGTGTQAGDPTEVRGAGYAFAATRDPSKPLIIGSIKSNVGHSEPAAGISGLIKTVLSIENGFIPGTPLFHNPSPKIDFVGNNVKASRTMLPWPAVEGKPKRASINSFGYGGANAHAIIEEAPTQDRARHVSSYISSDDDALSLEYEDAAEEARPYTLIVSANDAASLNANIQALCDHLVNPRVRVSLADLAYTLAERRSRLWHSAFVTTRGAAELDAKDFVVAKKGADAPRIGFVFTGQGAQWPQMGKQLLQYFPWTRAILEELDAVLQTVRDPPRWSLVEELAEPRSNEHMRQPEFSQPLVTAMQLCIIAVLESWGVKPTSVVGHSSGEIAAAYTAGFIDRASAIKAAFYRGRAAVNCQDKSQADSQVGMLAVGLGTEAVAPYLERYEGHAWIACFNSPSSLTISGKKSELEKLAEDIKADGHFARLLQVDLAYHSVLMDDIGDEYESLLSNDTGYTVKDQSEPSGVTMFSSAVSARLDETTPTDAMYWKRNMVSPVRFHEALEQMVTQPNQEAPNMLIEIGPSGALAGPVSQILKSLPKGGDVTYTAAWARGATASKSLFDVAGRLKVAGAPVDMAVVNGYKDQPVRTIIDLPNYGWNHSVRYWHENAASKDWRFRQFINHDLIGSKIFGTSWHNPTWRKHLMLDDVPWLRDHKMGPDVLIPGAGLATMAVEAMYQKYAALNPDKDIESSNDLAYHLRNVRFDRALVVEENKESTILLTLIRVPGKKDWHEFRISTSADDVVIDHCFGLIRVQPPVEEKLSGADLAPLRHPQPFTLWYKAQRDAGMGFGPSFKKVTSLEATSGQRRCRALVAMPANASNERSLVKDIIVPGIVNEAIINRVPRHMREGLAIAKSGYTGRGRPDQAKSIISDISVYDPETGAMLMEVKGLNYVKIDVPPKPDPHTFDRISWKPDVSLLSQDQLAYLEVEEHEAPSEVEPSKLHAVIDLIAHKKPMLKVLEVNLDEADTTSVWFGTDEMAARLAYIQYDFATVNAKTLVSVQSELEENRHSAFHLVTPDKSGLGLDQASSYNLVILKAPKKPKVGLDSVIANMKPLLAEGAYLLLAPAAPGSAIARAVTEPASESDEESDSFQMSESSTPSTMSVHSDDSLDLNSKGISSSVSSAPMTLVMTKDSMRSADSSFWNARKIHHLESTPGFDSVLDFTDSDGQAHYLLHKAAQGDLETNGPTAKNLVVVQLTDKAPGLVKGMKHILGSAGWTVTQQQLSSADHPLNLPTDAVVLVLDELFTPLLVNASAGQWDALKQLLSAGRPVLWVTKGSQAVVTNPNNALVHGLFRTVRHEDTMARLTTLDVQSSTSAATLFAIEKILGLVQAQTAEEEYAERDGVLRVQRVIPDAKVNLFKQSEVEGAGTVVKGLHENESTVQIRADRVGSLELTWTENHAGPIPVEPGFVEVEVWAVGVNFKDVATTMGIVPENEWMIGCECAGVVKRLGAGVSKFQVGDRVAVMRSGTYINRIQAPTERVQKIPSWMSFEEASTIPLVYMTALYSLYYLANLREGQSVLIHSAAGGVGLAAIQLAQYKKADVFVTVGTEDKRKFLSANFGIPANRMFSSRSTQFAQEIMIETDGRGVDVILNSLTGELLDASWRIMADGGNMIEIGKRDIVDRNTLAMEPFDRNCSFRAIDLSYTKQFKDELVEKLLKEIFDLVEARHISSIKPVVTYGFEDVPAALAYIRRGQHMGKIVITNHGEDVKVPTRPALRTLELKPDVSYLIVGGLKGLCGSVAIHLARSGAKHIIACSRSGTNDDASARIIQGCATYGCRISEARGDIADPAFVKSMFDSARGHRIAGIIQGAMVLRDKPYETMSHQDYCESIEAKVRGTWNLHEACQNKPVEFFTMLSSISGVVGNKGQANYAAANAFLDAFAHFRRGQGLAANAVDLGAIEDVGYIAEQGASYEARFDKKQWTPINEGVLRRILTYSILQQDVSNPLNAASQAQLITGLTFPLPNDGSSDLAGEDRFGYLFNAGSNAVIDDGENAGGNSADDVAVKAFRTMQASGADVATLAAACVELMLKQITKVLRLETEIEPGKPLMAYGLDSLSAVELRGWIRGKLGAELSTLDITNARSLNEMCDKIVSKLPAPAS
ncbi:polyketide synthase [Apiospora marii]|uniref:Polyketide synthase n=1 Tax=Apiospora marii TaxID=335849 RepID=A0ABR1SGR5_9PEZI